MFKNMMQLGKKVALFKKCSFTPKKFFSTKLSNDSFINGTSGIYIEKMHEQWKRDNKSVHTSWDIYFSNLEAGLDFQSAFQSPPTIDKGNSYLAKSKTNFSIFFFF